MEEINPEEQVDLLKVFDELNKNPDLIDDLNTDELEYLQNVLDEYKQFLKDKSSKK